MMRTVLFFEFCHIFYQQTVADPFAVFGMNKKRCCHKATGLVVACVAGGHILLATAGIAGLSFNAAQYMMDCGFGKSDNASDPSVFEGMPMNSEGKRKGKLKLRLLLVLTCCRRSQEQAAIMTVTWCQV